MYAGDITYTPFLGTIILLIITAVYAHHSKRLADIAIRYASNPVIGITLNKMQVTDIFERTSSRRNINIDMNLVNIGNAPATGVYVDGEIIFKYTDIKGEKSIPSRFEPILIPFIRPGEEIPCENESPNFGNTCIVHLFDDFREQKRLNLLRLETDPTKEPYTSSKLKIYVYYRNNLGQYFESIFQTYIWLEKIPEENESAEIMQQYMPTQQFYAGPISKDKMDKDISIRNSKRDLCGW